MAQVLIGIKSILYQLGHNKDTFLHVVSLLHILTEIQYTCGDMEAMITLSAKIGKFPKVVKLLLRLGRCDSR